MILKHILPITITKYILPIINPKHILPIINPKHKKIPYTKQMVKGITSLQQSTVLFYLQRE